MDDKRYFLASELSVEVFNTCLVFCVEIQWGNFLDYMLSRTSKAEPGGIEGSEGLNTPPETNYCFFLRKLSLTQALSNDGGT